MEEKVETRWNRNWPWHPWARNSAWIPLKKRWVKKGQITANSVSSTDVDIQVWTIVNYLTFWKKEIIDKENIKRKVKPNVALNITQACRELGISTSKFYQDLWKFPALKEKYELLRESKREYLRAEAEANIESWLTGKLEISDKDMMDASFKLLERTDKNYNPKMEIETKSININLTKTSEDLFNDLKEIVWR